MNIGVVRSHYDKSCSLEPHYVTTRAPKQQIYIYTKTRIRKYMGIQNKISGQKINKLHCSCNFVANRTLIQCNVHIIHTNIINHV
jgi:hypothetical protein